jgi:hypothetical protein
MIETIVSWFTALFRWIGRIFEWFLGMFKDLIEVISDIPVLILKGFLDGVIYLLSAIPVPAFLEGGGLLQGVFGALSSDVQYLVSFFGIPAALAIFGAGVVFRLTRKALTLGQW